MLVLYEYFISYLVPKYNTIIWGDIRGILYEGLRVMFVPGNRCIVTDSENNILSPKYLKY